MQFRLIILFIFMSFSASSLATTVAISFPSLNGVYSYPRQADPVSFDLGVQFSSITSASIEWTATGTAGSLQLCETGANQCYFLSPALFAKFYFEPEATVRDIGYFEPELGIWQSKPTPGVYGGGGVLGFDDPNAAHSFFLPKEDLYTMRDLLLDGKATLFFGTQDEGTFESYAESQNMTLTILTNPTFNVSDVTLTVEGTVVPVPAALPLLISGIGGLLFFQRKRKQA